MPEPYYPKRKGAYTLSDAGRNNDVIKVTCRYCRRARLFETMDLVEAFGDIEVDDVREKMRECLQCKSTFHTLTVEAVGRRSREAKGVTWRRRRLVWKDG